MDYIPLPKRQRQRPPTHKGMPHAQIGLKPVPTVNDELFRRCFSLPDVENRPTIISVPGTRALWLRDDLPLTHPEEIAAGREFAHIHPDGSLHASLSSERAHEAIEAGWAEPHPMALHIGRDGMVMLYTPLDMQELDTIFQLIVDSYNYVTGRNVEVADIESKAND